MRAVHAILSLCVAGTIIGDIVNWGFQRRCCYGAVVEGGRYYGGEQNVIKHSFT